MLPPDEHSLPAAAEWVGEVLADDERRAALGKAARALAEQEFDLSRCADRFEALLDRSRG